MGTDTEKNKIESRKPPRTAIVNDYFQWLCEMVRMDTYEDSYYFLAKVLYEKPFSWFVPNDDNRGMDGLKIRDEFGEETNWFTTLEWSLLNNSCTVFEMLIGLARRIADIMDQPDEEDQTVKWFWVLIENLGLEKYTDADFYNRYGSARVNHKLDILLDRTYKRNGEGGLFPLKLAKKDQRKVEIWYQMSAYLVENYYINGEFR